MPPCGPAQLVDDGGICQNCGMDGQPVCPPFAAPFECFDGSVAAGGVCSFQGDCGAIGQVACPGVIHLSCPHDFQVCLANPKRHLNPNRGGSVVDLVCAASAHKVNVTSKMMLPTLPRQCFKDDDPFESRTASLRALHDIYTLFIYI